MISIPLVLAKELSFDLLVYFKSHTVGAHNAEEVCETVEDFGLKPEVWPFAAEKDAGMSQDIDVVSAYGGGDPSEPFFQELSFCPARDMSIIKPHESALGVSVGGNDEWPKARPELLDESAVAVARVDVDLGAQPYGDLGFKGLELLLQEIQHGQLLLVPDVVGDGDLF